jgi:hypothetical protein
MLELTWIDWLTMVVVVAGVQGLAMLGIRWQNQCLQAEMDAVTRATCAKMARSFAESQAAMAERRRQWQVEQAERQRV